MEANSYQACRRGGFAGGGFSYFFFQCYGDPRDLHSFPTRRSSDLRRRARGQALLDPERRAEHAVLFAVEDRKSTRLNSSHVELSYAVFCLNKRDPEITELAVAEWGAVTGVFTLEAAY